MSELLYVARPIDRFEESDDPGWLFLHQVEEALREHAGHAKLGLYEPACAFEVEGLAPGEFVRKVNNFALGQADALLAIWPDGASSWGVPAEVERAVMQGKPVVIVTNGKPSWSMLDMSIEVVQPHGKTDPAEMVRIGLQHIRQQLDVRATEQGLREAVKNR